MKNYLKPISMTFMATVLCVSTANAGLFDIFKGKKPAPRPIPQQPIQNPVQIQPDNSGPARNYGPYIPATEAMNSSLVAELSANPQAVGQTKIDINSVRSLYGLRGNRAIWINQNGLSSMGLALYDILKDMAEYHGLSSEYYLTSDLVNLLNQIPDIMMSNDLSSLAKIDILLTQGYIQFAKDISTGRINPRDPNQNLKDIEMKKFPAPTLETLNSFIYTTDSLMIGTANLAPKVVGYISLLESLAKINDGMIFPWSPLDPSVSLKFYPEAGKQVSHPNVIGLRQRLVDFGYLDASMRNNKSQVYDATLYAAVRRFQENNFMGVDGVVGGEVYKVMTRSQQSFKNQIRANLEKWRFHPRNFPQRYMMVDMGRQQLDVIDNGRLVIRMNTVVGKDVNGTPTMTDRVTSVLLAPYWHSPKSIMVKETIPNFGNNPAAYLSARNVEVLNSSWQPLSPLEINKIDWRQYTMENPPPYTFREMNGPTASLGLVKFNLTNGHSIYLHDTNNPAAFKKRVRYLSHGCIRLERPFDLVAYLLNGTSDPNQLAMDSAYWKEQAAQIAMNMGRQRELEAKLKDGSINIYEKSELDALRAMKLKPEEIPAGDVPVFIFGSTTVNYMDGSIGFGEDAYKQDERIIQVMDQLYK